MSGSVPPPVKVRVAIKSRMSGFFVTAPVNVSKPLVATSAGIGDLNRFILYDNYDGPLAIQSEGNGLYVAVVSANNNLTASSVDRKITSRVHGVSSQ